MTTETADYRWWLTGDQIPADWRAKVVYAIHSSGAEQCCCATGDEHQFMLGSYADDAVYALEAAAPLAADAERKRVLAGLRESVRKDRELYYEYALDHGEQGHEEQEHRYYGRVAQCDDMLAAMDRLEAGQ